MTCGIYKEEESVVIIKRPLNTIILPARVQLVTQLYVAEEGGWYYDYRFVLIILIHPRQALLLLLLFDCGWLLVYQELYNLLDSIKAGALHVPRFNYSTQLFIELPQLRRTIYTIGINLRTGSGIYLLLFTDRHSSIKTEPFAHSFLHSRAIQSTIKDRLETMNDYCDIGGSLWISCFGTHTWIY